VNSGLSHKTLQAILLLGLLITAIGVLAVPRIPVPKPGGSPRIVTFQRNGWKIEFGMGPNGFMENSYIDHDELAKHGFKGPYYVELKVVDENGKTFFRALEFHHSASKGKESGHGFGGGRVPPGKYLVTVKVYSIRSTPAESLDQALSSFENKGLEAADSQARKAVSKALAQGYCVVVLSGQSEIVVQQLEYCTPQNPITLMGIALTAPAALLYGRNGLKDKREGAKMLALTATVYVALYILLSGLPQVLAYLFTFFRL